MRAFVHLLGLVAITALVVAFTSPSLCALVLPIALALLFGYVTALDHLGRKQAAGRD